jgi:transcription antitermination factor NusG
VTLELSRQGELKVEDGTLIKVLTKDHPIFIPAINYNKRGKNITIHLLEGYVFVASGLCDVAYFNLENKNYIKKVISTKGKHGVRVLKVVSNSMISKLKYQLRELVSSDITVGTKVRVLEGAYKELEGDVVDIEGPEAGVFFEFRTLSVVVYIPKVFLLVVS